MLKQSKALVAVLALFILGGSHTPLRAQKDNRFEISKNLEIFNALVKEMEMFYVDSVDIEKSLRRGINSMLAGLDPYTEYIPEENMDNLQLMATGEYGGMGSLIRQRPNGEGVIVAEPYEGMPAALAGLQAGDRFLFIDSVDVSKANNDEVSKLLKGVPNTKMTVTIQRPGEKKPRKIDIVRKQIVINQVTYYGVQDGDVGYIYLSGFTDKSGQEVKAAFEDLKNNHNIKSLILDLRDNGGGVLEAAVQIVGLFVPKGSEVISTKGKIKQWDRVYRTSVEPIDTVIPLAVLINENSASSSEIVAGAMQDLDRAILVGQRSFGKGLVQSTRDLPYDGKLKVTISRYYIPSGRCIQQLDYSHRRADGSVAAIPDSLTTVFHTVNGREVRDGGGIRPDFEVEAEDVPTMIYYLMNDYALFDFVTDWVQKQKTRVPIEEFTVTDEDFEALKAYAKEKEFSYDKQSTKALKQLKEIAEFEGYLKNDSTLFDSLEEKLTPDLERDFDRNKEAIKKLLASEIVVRNYYQRGRVMESLKDDKVLDKAIEVLHNQELYQSTFHTMPNP
ncbi:MULTISPECIES: S41 family peptidase [unclassified Parabacteroides]|uniref:S41 family peptidase n=1 Tax=unclassified Parabacteroides TaxID=2649774 RepID=UPI00247675B9|nr:MULTISPECIES: S41 family peptidase [unclassified Parabacteroides]